MRLPTRPSPAIQLDNITFQADGGGVDGGGPGHRESGTARHPRAPTGVADSGARSGVGTEEVQGLATCAGPDIRMCLILLLYLFKLFISFCPLSTHFFLDSCNISGNCTLRASSRLTKFFHYPLPPFKRPRLRNITDYAPSLLDSQVRVRSDLNLQVSHFHLVKPVSSLSDPLCWTTLL